MSRKQRFKKVICRECGIKFEMMQIRKEGTRCTDCLMKGQMAARKKLIESMELALNRI